MCVALLIFRYRSDEWFSYVAIFLLMPLGAGGVSLVFMDSLDKTALPEMFQIIATMTVMPVYLFFSLFLLTFPNGRFIPSTAPG